MSESSAASGITRELAPGKLTEELLADMRARDMTEVRVFVFN